VGVGDHELDPDQPTGHQPAQELAPEGLGLGLADIESDDLPPAGLVHAVGHDHALAHHASAVSDLLDLGVEEEVGVAALKRPRPEGLDLLVEAGADARDLGLRDPEAERLDDLVDLARGDPGHVGLLDDGHERLLGALSRLQEAREVAALAELRDRDLELAGARVEAPGAVAVSVGGAVLGALSVLGADQP